MVICTGYALKIAPFSKNSAEQRKRDGNQRADGLGFGWGESVSWIAASTVPTPRTRALGALFLAVFND